MDRQTINKLQTKTRFDRIEVKKLWEIFDSCSNNKQLDRKAFVEALHLLQDEGCATDTPFGERLFDLLDINGDGVLDLQEFVIGLSFLCKGSIEEKLELSFKAYDLDGNGFITKDELQHMFKQAWVSGFKTLMSVHGDFGITIEELETFADELASSLSESAFDSLDLNGDGKLSFDEFAKFAIQEPQITATLNGHEVAVQIAF
eukprot:CAMPEP_0174262276 /NCGR_PEP_ID=MMETSP0439-20130205/12884_1 /TAXON_ID=0 /ORGANISM="Stereomyxa ramosa, Strain Chinc5" /LENGTH=202 /DNA_ID=CAMNT_0015346965 /DNA_START=99 /DNA_END=707 /DNA_ORIENTATION=+